MNMVKLDTKRTRCRECIYWYEYMFLRGGFCQRGLKKALVRSIQKGRISCPEFRDSPYLGIPWYVVICIAVFVLVIVTTCNIQ